MKPETLKLPSTDPKEKDIESKVTNYAKNRDFYVRKFSSPGTRSVPDRVFVSPEGVVAFIEFKAPGKKPTLAQLHEISELKKRRAYVTIVDNVQAGKEYVDWLLNLRWGEFPDA